MRTALSALAAIGVMTALGQAQAQMDHHQNHQMVVQHHTGALRMSEDEIHASNWQTHPRFRGALTHQSLGYAVESA